MSNGFGFINFPIASLDRRAALDLKAIILKSDPALIDLTINHKRDRQ